jgi:guanosine-3',5'-bis(diphosphate) 3'-pyrophosphohydrolase
MCVTYPGQVLEVTDDRLLSAAERKRVQVERAHALSLGAKLIRVSDKLCNVRDLLHDPPHGWSVERQRSYLDWSERVVAECRGVNAGLEDAYDKALRAGREFLGDLRETRNENREPG